MTADQPLAILPAGHALAGTPQCQDCGTSAGALAPRERSRAQTYHRCRECRAKHYLRGFGGAQLPPYKQIIRSARRVRRAAGAAAA